MTASDLQQAVRLLEGAETVIVCCHVAPDGDALGSMIGLGRFLGRKGKKVWMSWGSDNPRVPPQYAFLPGLDDLSAHDQLPDNADVFVAIDCGDIGRLELLQGKFHTATSTINVDHHISNNLFADVNIVEPDRASSSELAFELIKAFGEMPDAEEAMCLYTGIVTDTGRFQYPSTSAETLRSAAELRDLGIEHHVVGEEVYESASFGFLRVLGIVLSRARLDEGIVWSWVEQADLDGLDLDETEHFIDVLRSVRGSKVAVILKQVPEGTYKVSLRSRGEVDVSALAQRFGGGGHARAAGFTSHRAVDETMAAIKSAIGS